MKVDIYSKRENKFVRLFMICFCAAITIAFSILTIFSWGKANAAQYNSYKDRFKNASLLMENEMDRLDYVAALLSQNTWVGNLIGYSRSDFDAMSVAEKNRYFKDMKVYNSFLGTSGNIVLYFKNADIILTSTEICDYDWYYNKVYHLPGYSKEDYHQLLKNSKKQYLGMQTVESYDYSRMLNTYIRSLPIVSDDLSIIVSTDQEYYQNVLYAFLDTSSQQYSIVQKDNGNVLAQNITDKNLEAALGKDIDSNVNGYTKYSIDFRKNEITLNVYVVQDISMAKARVVSIMPGILLYSVVMILGLFIIRSIHNAYINRIKKLNSLFSKINVDEPGLSSEALFMLENNIRDILNTENVLKKNLESESGKIKSTYLNMLLKGRLEKREESERTLAFLNVDIKASCFVCLMSGIKEPLNFYDPLNLNVQVECIHDEDCLVYIVFGDSTVREQWIQYVNLQISDTGGILGGLGDVCSGVFELPYSYKQAQFICEYASLMSYRGIAAFTPDCLKAKNCTLDGEFKSRLSSEILNRKQDKYCKDIRDLCARIRREIFVPSSVRAVFREILDLLNTIADEKRIRISDNVPEISESSIEGFEKAALSCGSCIIEKLSQHKDEEQIKFYGEIKNFLDENISNPALSLKLVSEHFYVSNSYISRFFLEYSKVNFLEYIQNRRIEMAKQFLLDDQNSIDSVAEKAGFDNSVTFRRVFKSHVGMTPSDYRTYAVKN